MFTDNFTQPFLCTYYVPDTLSDAGDQWMAKIEPLDIKTLQCSEGASVVTWATRGRGKDSSPCAS